MLVNMVKNLSKNRLHHFQEFFSVAREAHVILYVRSSVIKLRDTWIGHQGKVLRQVFIFNLKLQ